MLHAVCFCAGVGVMDGGEWGFEICGVGIWLDGFWGFVRNSERNGIENVGSLRLTVEDLIHSGAQLAVIGTNEPGTGLSKDNAFHSS